MKTTISRGIATLLVLVGLAATATAQELAFVVNRGNFWNPGTTVTVFDSTTFTELTTIEVGEFPTELAVTPDYAFLYVTVTGEDAVAVVSVADLTVVEKIPVPGGPLGIAIMPDGSHAYVTNRNDHTVSVIRLSDNTVVETITGPDPTVSGDDYFLDTPHGIAITPDGRYAYVANVSFDRDPGSYPSLTVISTADNMVVATPDCCGVALNFSATGWGPWDVTIVPDGKTAYTNSGDVGEELYAVDTDPESPTWNEMLAILPASATPESGPRGMESGEPPLGVRVFAGTAETSEIVVIDPTTMSITSTLSTKNAKTKKNGSWPWRLRLNTAGAHLWVSLKRESKVMVLDTSTYAEVARFPVDNPADIAFVPFNVEIDIDKVKPSKKKKKRSNKKIKVAILSTPSFDASSAVPSSVAFGPNGAQAIDAGKIRDVNRDGYPDLQLRFLSRDTGLACGDTEATLTGLTFFGAAFYGTDEVDIKGCGKGKKAKKKKSDSDKKAKKRSTKKSGSSKSGKKKSKSKS